MAEKPLAAEQLLVISEVGALCAARSVVRSYVSDPVSKHTIPKLRSGDSHNTRGQKSHSKRFFVSSQLFSILNSTSCEVQRSYLSAKNRPRF